MCCLTFIVAMLYVYIICTDIIDIYAVFITKTTSLNHLLFPFF